MQGKKGVLSQPKRRCRSWLPNHLGQQRKGRWKWILKESIRGLPAWWPRQIHWKRQIQTSGGTQFGKASSSTFLFIQQLSWVLGGHMLVPATPAAWRPRRSRLLPTAALGGHALHGAASLPRRMLAQPTRKPSAAAAVCLAGYPGICGAGCCRRAALAELLAPQVLGQRVAAGWARAVAGAAWEEVRQPPVAKRGSVARHHAVEAKTAGGGGPLRGPAAC